MHRAAKAAALCVAHPGAAASIPRAAAIDALEQT
jgi:sugar/nucleoside kinase (ribokinase family)